MEIPKSELFAVLQEFNPWWSGQSMVDLPDWERSAAREVWNWIEDVETKRSLLLTGARQVGKTTIYRQIIRRLLNEGFPSTNILYVTFDHPLFKLAGLEKTLRAWEELFPPNESNPQFLFLDEVQYVDDWQTWLKHQVDFQRRRRIAVTGSAISLTDSSSESGVGRWETIPLATLSFSEYLQLRKIIVPDIPKVRNLLELFEWSEGEFARGSSLARSLTVHFHEYLLRGGFPEPATITELSKCQRLLREDIVDKVLKRDMTALYGVRRVIQLEKLFLYLCYHDGGIIDITVLSRDLQEVTKKSVLGFLDLFESTHLIYRLKPFGYGKAVLRGKDKIYLADAALPGATLLLGRKLLEQPIRLGAAVETAFFKHVFTRFYSKTPTFSYWRGSKHEKEFEVDLIAEAGNRTVPFEVKYQDTEITQRLVKGLRLFMEERKLEHGYVITQRSDDFRLMKLRSARVGHERTELSSKVLLIPAPLACYWLAP